MCQISRHPPNIRRVGDTVPGSSDGEQVTWPSSVLDGAPVPGPPDPITSPPSHQPPQLSAGKIIRAANEPSARF